MIKQVDLIATSVIFKKFSIVYDVKCSVKLPSDYIVCCPFDICEKDLILKPSVINKNQMKVIYTPSNVTPEFYERIHKGIMKNQSEFEIEKKWIYDIGDVVGVILV